MQIHQSYLYLISSNGFLKFGIASNWKRRLSAYKTHNPEIKVERIWIGNSAEIAAYEKQIHKNFKHLRCNGSDWIKTDINNLEIYFLPINLRFERVDVKSLNIETNLDLLKKGKYFDCNKKWGDMSEWEKEVRKIELRRLSKKEIQQLSSEELHSFVMSKFD